ncbi:MAG: hypothetical protein ACXVKA_14295 [Acidimicrobiia bacterium]
MTTGSNPGPLHGAMAQSEVLRTRVGTTRVPESVIAAAHEERSLRRLKRRIGWMARVGLIR